MTAPMHDTATDAEKAAPVEGAADAAGKKVEGRSLKQIAWNRLKQDKVALAGAVVVVVLVLVSVFAPLLVSLFGHPPNQGHLDQLEDITNLPKGALGGISGDFLFGVEPNTGRDVFSRIVYGARVSMLVAVLAALVAVALGTLFGIIAGFFGGWVDALISRVMDVLLSFPQLLFIIALVSVLPDDLFGLTGSGVRIATLILVIGLFGWPYIGRIVRGQTLSLREREYVEAARSLGGGSRHILFKELLPNLVAPITVYTTLMIPTNILTEAALSFLGAGVRPPTASWGGMLRDALQVYEHDPMFMVFPGLAIFITVLAFNLFGDGLRDALDPKGTR
ncbi:ABC transporter permease [Streptomyces sp. NPDC002851]